MKISKRNALYQQAIDLWGENAQIDMMVEECAELIQALQKRKRASFLRLKVAEEIADVEIMCEQMKLIFDAQLIKKYKQDKLIRLFARIDAEKEARQCRID